MAKGVSDYSYVLAQFEQVLVEAQISKSSVLASPERDLRVETWAKKANNGNRRIYWQWCERGASTGKRGGKRYRVYGGTLETIPEGSLSERQRTKRSRHFGNFGELIKESI